MKKLVAIVFAALLAILPISAQATSQSSAFDEWLKTGTANGWIVDGKVTQPVAPAPTPIPTTAPTPTTAPAATGKALVIVDSYFDSSKISGNVIDVCLARVGCELTPNPISGVSSAFHHGTAMAELARKANPDATLYLVRAASAFSNPRTGVVTMQVINGNDFLNALRFAKSKQDEVGAVSFSYSLNGNMPRIGDCRLSTVGMVNVAITDPAIRAQVAELKDLGIPVFAATGNDGNRKPVSYPACIPDVMSVASGIGDNFLSTSNHDATTDYVGALPANIFNFTSATYRTIPLATSSATASVAALWVAGKVSDKWVRLAR
jgi:hypothetical protein